MERLIHGVPNWNMEIENADIPSKQMLFSSIIDRMEVEEGDIKIRFKIRLEDFAGCDGMVSE